MRGERKRLLVLSLTPQSHCEEVLPQMNTDGEVEAFRGRHRLWLWGRIISVPSPGNVVLICVHPNSSAANPLAIPLNP